MEIGVISKKIIKKLLPTYIIKYLAKIYNKVTNRKIPVHINNVFGFDIYQNNTDVIDYSRYKRFSINNLPEDEDSRIFKFIKYFIRSGDVTLDIGANIGLMTLVMSDFCGDSGKVISFEPGPVSSSLLKRNCYVNGRLGKNVVIKEFALSDFNGQVSLFICPTGESDNQVHKGIQNYEFGDEKFRPKVDITARKLDDVLEEEEIDINRLSFVKIDTQGHEWYVINGAKKVFSEATELVVLCEFAPYLKSWENLNIEKFYHLIKSLGFTIYDTSEIKNGEIDLTYLLKNYGFKFAGKYTDLLLVKGNKFNYNEFVNIF